MTETTTHNLIIIESNNYKVIKDIITSKGLWEVSYGQNTLNTAKSGQIGTDTAKQNFEVEQNGFRYLLILSGDTVIGCMQIRPLTKILLEGHIYILQKYWGTGISDKALRQSYSYVKSLGYRQIFTDVPEECKEVQNLLKRTGWKQCGLVPEGVIFNNKLQDLKFFRYNLLSEV